MAALDSLFEHADFGLALLDAELRFQRVNAALARINAELPEMTPKVRDVCAGVLETGESVAGVIVEGAAEDGSTRTFDCSYHPVESAGVAVGLLAMVREVTEERQARESEHRIATQLQVSLMPERLPDVPGMDIASGFRPAGEIGGDFYDVFEMTDGCWMVVIGDVCGKGAEAAALTALARYTLRAAAIQEGAEPVTLLTQLNEAILRQRDDMRFLSVVCAFLDLDPEGGAGVRVSVAGHLPPLLVEDGGAVTPVGGNGGRVLGVWDDLELTEEEIRLQPGQRLVLYTDGVLDAQRSAELTERGLAHLLGGFAAGSAAETVAQIERAVLGEAAGEGRDDIAVLVLRPR